MPHQHRYTTVLFVPASRPELFAKAWRSAPDAVCFDLEDSVAPGDKAQARDILAQFLKSDQPMPGDVLVRVNADSLAEDVLATLSRGVFAVSLPKVRSAQQLREADAELSRRERQLSLPSPTFKVLPWIELPEALLNLPAIASATERLAGLAFGSEDMARALGLPTTAPSEALDLHRTQVAVAAHAVGVQALDAPELSLRPEHSEAASRRARNMGYTGKFCVHPTQVEAVRSGFQPSAEELAWAHAVVEAYREAQASGLGACRLDGRVIDRPVYERALFLGGQSPT